MRIKYIIFLLIFSFTGCGTGVILPLDAEPEFIPYINQFQQDAQTYGNKTIVVGGHIHFVDNLDANYVGFCNSVGPGITILRSFWNDIDDTAKTILLYHELGHCNLGRGHETDFVVIDIKDEDGVHTLFNIPKTIMYPNIDPVYPSFAKFKEYYLRELFQNP